jgi:hypothetical protein
MPWFGLLLFAGALAWAADTPTEFSIQDTALVADSITLTRAYTIALPNANPPSYSVQNLQVKTLDPKECALVSQSAKPRTGPPLLRDGLWRVPIHMPLIYKEGGACKQRTIWRLTVRFSGAASGLSPGARALSLVANPHGARQFALPSKIKRRLTPLARSATADHEWLLRIAVGDREPATQNEDGMVGFSFADFRNALRKAGLTNTNAIEVQNLRLYAHRPDTLPQSMGALGAYPEPFEVPRQVVDKNGNGLFDSNDSLLFFGYGTGLWKRTGKEGMEYSFSHSPYNFYQYFYLGVSAEGTPPSFG